MELKGNLIVVAALHGIEPAHSETSHAAVRVAGAGGERRWYCWFIWVWMRTVYKETIPIITKSLQKLKVKPVIKVLDEHVALSTSFSSITPPVVLIKSCLHDQNQIGLTWGTICLQSEWLGMGHNMPTGSQPRVDLALWFASAIGPNFSPREWTPDHLCVFV